MKRCSIWAAVLSASVAVPFTGCSHLPTAMLPASAKAKVLDSKMEVAQNLENKKELKKAKKAYEDIFEADPKRAMACHRLAIVSYRLGEREEALKYFKQAEELTPESPELLSDYGYALYKMKKLKEAEKVLQKSVKLEPDNERAVTRLATVLGTEGKMHESYTQLCKISTPAEAHEIIAHLHAQRGEKREALDRYQRSLALSKMAASERSSLRRGSKEFKQNQQLLARVQQNIAQLSSDPTLKAAAQSDVQMARHSGSTSTKPKVDTVSAEKDLFRKVDVAQNTSAKPKTTPAAEPTKEDFTPKTEVAAAKDSPFRVIRDRIAGNSAREEVQDPFLADSGLNKSAFEQEKTEVVEVKAEMKAGLEDTKRQQKPVQSQLDEMLARAESQAQPEEDVTFRKLTDEAVAQVEESSTPVQQPFQEVREQQVASASAKPATAPSPQKRSAYELMRELQTELISDFTPPKAERVQSEPEFHQVAQSAVPQESQNPFQNYHRDVAKDSPFEDAEVAQIGTWNPVDPKSKMGQGKISTVSRQIEVEPVQPVQKPVVQNVSLSQPKREIVPPDSAAALCPNASGEVLYLVKQLDSQDVPELKQAIQRLGAMEAEAIASVPALRSLSLHDNMGVRIQSAFSLWKIEGNTDDSVPTLIEAMNSSVESDRSFAAAVLAQIGYQSQELTPILVRSLSDNNAYVRLHTAELLARDPEWRYQANKTLSECLVSKDVNIRWLACYSLADLRPEDERVVAALSLALQDKASQVRAGAAYALGEIGPFAHKAIPELQKARFDTNSDVRTAARNALARVRHQINAPSAN
ncbi:HEAT repeat domain-containing protein [Gimesia panareensis]|uniref:HEAT repeat domain-containing protein n=1 Tax=Gimesia panareensis TaxID=2527978 RepID=UPI00118AED91|nr:HEAT repeat domain-containing protein [Gimesia panareensis]QDU48151.1 invasion protein regulator [Gimesia panareensis]